MKRILLLLSFALATLVLILHGQDKHAAATQRSFNVVEASISEMRTAMEQGRLTSRELVTQYLARIGMYEDKLHCIITRNPNALQEAAERARQPPQDRRHGPPPGIPTALEANLPTPHILPPGAAPSP